MRKKHTLTRMSLCVLGSGSSGNCSVIVCESDQSDRTITLIDLGLSPRETVRRLHRVGIDIADVSSALITHFDSDHFNPGWVRGAVKHSVTLRFDKHHRGWAQRRGALSARCEPFKGSFELSNGVKVDPVRLEHDDLGSFGFRIEADCGAIGFATDLGCVERPVFKAFVDLTILAIESNYCPELEEASNRPWFLKERIMGGYGHLSNEESLAAVLRIANKSPQLAHIVKLHLSQQCNDPQLIHELYADRAPHLADKLTITHPRRSTTWIHVQAAPIALTT